MAIFAEKSQKFLAAVGFASHHHGLRWLGASPLTPVRDALSCTSSQRQLIETFLE